MEFNTGLAVDCDIGGGDVRPAVAVPVVEPIESAVEFEVGVAAEDNVRPL